MTGPAPASGLDREIPLPLIPADTTMTDRQLLIHALQHIEQLHADVQRFADVLEEFGPLIERWRAHGRRGTRLF
jgi:hypothetical protein